MSAPLQDSTLAQLRLFLDRLWIPGTWIEVRPIMEGPDAPERYRADNRRRAWLTAAELADVAEGLIDECRRLRPPRAVFIGVLPRIDREGTRKSVDNGRVVWADIDDKTTGSRAASWEEVRKIDPPPSAIVCSGRGLHIYYFLESPQPGEEIQKVNLLLLRLCKGDPAVHDPTRIMRLPGSWHCKGEPVRTYFEELHPDRGYDLDGLRKAWRMSGDLLGGAPRPERKRERPAPEEGRVVPIRKAVPALSAAMNFLMLEVPSVRDLYEGRGLSPRPGRPEVTGSHYDYQFAREALYHGASQEDVEDALRIRVASRGKRGLKSASYYSMTAGTALAKLDGRRAPRPYKAAADAAVSADGNPLGLDVFPDDHPTRSKRGQIKAVLPNCVGILQRCPLMAGRLKYNEFKGQIELDGEKFTDIGITRLRLEMSRAHRVNFGRDMAAESIDYAASLNRYHPVRDWLLAVAAEHGPDPALADAWLFRAGAAEARPGQDRLIAEMGRKWLISAVKRILEPGCKVDSTLILIGPQGAGKSMLFREMAHRPEWFSDSAIDVRGGRDTYSRLKGVWIYEFAELAATRTRENEATKAFLTSQIDIYRPAYARYDIEVPRQCVFVGTSNELEILRDPTGARRFWPVRLAGELDIGWIRENHARIWAAAVHLAQKDGAIWHLGEEMSATLREHQAIHQATDTWLEAVEGALKLGTDTGGAEGLATGRHYQLKDILLKACGVEAQHQNRAAIMRLAGLLSAMGWRKERLTENRRRTNKWIWGTP